MQEIWVWSLVWEDATCHRATKPMHHNYWACALEPWNCKTELTHHNCWSLHALEPEVCNKRSHSSEKPTHGNEDEPCSPQLEEDLRATKTQHSQKEISKCNYLKTCCRRKEGHYIMIKGSIQEEDKTITNIYAPNIGTPQCIRQINANRHTRGNWR